MLAGELYDAMGLRRGRLCEICVSIYTPREGECRRIGVHIGSRAVIGAGRASQNLPFASLTNRKSSIGVSLSLNGTPFGLRR